MTKKPLTVRQIVAKVAALNNKAEASYLAIGRHLQTLSDQGLSGTEIAALVDMKSRTVFNLLSIGLIVKDKLVTAAQVRQIGYSRAALLAPRLARGEITVKDFLASKKQSLANLGRFGLTKQKTSVAVFKFTSDQQKVLDQALRNHGALEHGRGLRNKEQALMAILVQAGMAEARAA